MHKGENTIYRNIKFVRFMLNILMSNYFQLYSKKMPF